MLEGCTLFFFCVPVILSLSIRCFLIGLYDSCHHKLNLSEQSVSSETESRDVSWVNITLSARKRILYRALGSHTHTHTHTHIYTHRHKRSELQSCHWGQSGDVRYLDRAEVFTDTETHATHCGASQSVPVCDRECVCVCIFKGCVCPFYFNKLSRPSLEHLVILRIKYIFSLFHTFYCKQLICRNVSPHYNPIGN